MRTRIYIGTVIEIGTRWLCMYPSSSLCPI